MFYGVLWLSVWRKFILALSKNHAFYVVFGFRGGTGRKKKDKLKEFQHSLAELVDMMGQDGLK